MLNPLNGSHMIGAHYKPQYAQTISRASNLQQIYAPTIAGQQIDGQQTQAPYYVDMVAANQQYESLVGLFERQAALNRPLCRCRVMYLGSSVPHITKNGLHGIQEPLKHLYPEEQFHGGAQTLPAATKFANAGQTIDISHLSSGLGIDSWLSVWSNGILLQNVDEFGREIRRFFSIESLHYCAAVRYFDTAKLKDKRDSPSNLNDIPSMEVSSSSDGIKGNATNGQRPNGRLDNQQQQQQTSQMKLLEDQNNNNNYESSDTTAPSQSEKGGPRVLRGPVRFLPLDAPLFRWPGMLDPSHPPVFASILRRTTGIKVLECHAFICRRDAAANALVRCCTHAYGDFISAKRLSLDLGVACGAATLRPSAPGRISGAATMTMGRHQTQQRRNRSRQTDTVADRLLAGSSQLASSQSAGQSSSWASNGEESRHSLEASNSSEDNYAIISKSTATSKRNQMSATRTLAEPQRRDANGAASNVRGSSRSLFDDFMPNEQGDLNSEVNSETNLARPTGGRLSRSSDQLVELAELAGCQLDCCSSLAKRASGQRPSVGLANKQGECEGAQCGIDSNKSRRHSRSMQNLGHLYGVSGKVGSTDRGERLLQQDSRQSARKIGRKSGRPTGSSGRRQSGKTQKARKAASYQDMRDNSIASLQSIANLNPRTAPSVKHSDASEISVQQSGQTNTMASSFGVPSSVRSRRRTERVRRAQIEQDCCRDPSSQPPTLQHQLHHHQQHQHYLSQQMRLGAAPPALGLYPACCPPPPVGQSLYASPAYLPAYYVPAPQLYAADHLASPIYAEPPVPAGLEHLRNYPPNKQYNNSQSKHNLARFRCLSPPSNLLDGATLKASHRHQLQTGQHLESSAAGGGPIQAQVQAQEEQQASQSVQMSQHEGAKVKSSTKSGRLSWIKRLSLTLSSASNSGSIQLEPGVSASQDKQAQVAQQQQQQQNPGKQHKRSSLFAGSLTLGRARSHAKLALAAGGPAP